MFLLTIHIKGHLQSLHHLTDSFTHTHTHTHTHTSTHTLLYRYLGKTKFRYLKISRKLSRYLGKMEEIILLSQENKVSLS